MSGKRRRTIVTVLISCCFIIACSAFVYWYAGHHYTKGRLYVTYFSSSILGLTEDSPVTYMGVPVGRVVRIGIAPDGKHVEVLFEVYDSFRQKGKPIAQLEPVGFSGGLVLGLDTKKPGEVLPIPKLVFPVPYFVVLSRPSHILTPTDISDLAAKIDKVLEHIKASND